jgi:hypothetical protein
MPAQVFTASLQFPITVVVSTGGSAAPYAISADKSGVTFTNEGATEQAYFTLPTAVAGATAKFIVQDADGIRVTAAAGDTIRLAGNVSAAAGYIASTTIGSTVTLTAINATEWVADSLVGTWSIDS